MLRQVRARVEVAFMPLFPEFPAEDQRHHHEALMLAVQRVLQSGRFITSRDTER